jgi:putative inorganic carbon (hco3(-)) transporter
VFLLIAVGRVGELIPGLASLPLARIVMVIALPALALNWKSLPRLPAVAIPFKRSALALTAIAVLTAPLSVWPGQTLQFLSQQLPVLAVAVIMACKISSSWRAIRRILRALIVCALALGLSALARFHGGRASSSGATYDTNDLAYVLVTVMPLALGFLLTAKTVAARIVNVAVLAVVVITILLTGSRGGFLALLAALAMLVLLPMRRPQPHRSGGIRRQRVVPALLAMLCLSFIVWPYLPQETRTRLATVVALGGDYNADTSNPNSRSAVWQRSLYASLRRPIGYGIDTFAMVDYRAGGRFRAPHNSYLGVLTELGFVGLFLFLRIYVLSWRALQRARLTLLATASNDERDTMIVFARMLLVALVGNVVAGFFLSMAYATLLWVLFSLVFAFASVVTSSTENPAQVPLGKGTI